MKLINLSKDILPLHEKVGEAQYGEDKYKMLLSHNRSPMLLNTTTKECFIMNWEDIFIIMDNFKNKQNKQNKE